MNRNTLLLLLIILAIAAFFRLWQLDIIPPGLWPDETANTNDALESLETGNFKVFYPANHGREGLFMWLIAASFSSFGVSVWSFKIVPALIGILTVLGLYLLTKELFSRQVALLASFFLAISFWHINFSRIGFRAILLPLILTFAFYFFFRGIRTKRILDFILCGLIFGVGFYTYISFRLAVLVMAFALIAWFLMALREKWAPKYLVSASFLLLSTFLVALPIGIYFLENPEQFFSRALGVSVFETEEPVKEFLKSLGKHLAMFNFAGDLNWRHNLAGFPQLSPLAGIFFLLGIIFALRHINAKYLFLLVWLFALLLPGALTVEGIPHALRTIGVIPAAYIFTGLGGYHTYEWSKSKIRNIKIIGFSLLALMAVFSFILYFFVWAKSPELKSAFPLNPSDEKVWRIVP